jgi:hypothetical protein
MDQRDRTNELILMSRCQEDFLIGRDRHSSVCMMRFCTRPSNRDILQNRGRDLLALISDQCVDHHYYGRAGDA